MKEREKKNIRAQASRELGPKSASDIFFNRFEPLITLSYKLNDVLKIKLNGAKVYLPYSLN